MRSFVREKKTYCGDKYMEVDLYILNENQLEHRKNKRSKKEKVSMTKQMKYNEKKARRYFVQLVETNFENEDIFITLTYNDMFLPKSLEDAEREVRNYIRRIRRRRVKEGCDELKYVLVTSSSEREGEIRVHHHIIMNSGLSRDVCEELWRKKKGVPIGRANSRRVQEDFNSGLVGLSTYLMRNKTQKRMWTCSQNLERPWSRTNDHKYSKKKFLSYALNPYDIEVWEKIYKPYKITDKDMGIEVSYNDISGYSIYLKLRKKDILKC